MVLPMFGRVHRRPSAVNIKTWHSGSCIGADRRLNFKFGAGDSYSLEAGMPKWIQFPRIEGIASRQAHADLPPGTYEREIGRDGFYGPATHMYHRHPPTG